MKTCLNNFTAEYKKLVFATLVIIVIMLLVTGCEKEEEYDPYADTYVIRIEGIPENAKWDWKYFSSETTINIYRPDQSGAKPGTYVATNDRDDFGEDWIQAEMFSERTSGGWAIGTGSGQKYHGDGGPFNIMLKYRIIYGWGTPNYGQPDTIVELYVKNKKINYGINKIPFSDFAPW